MLVDSHRHLSGAIRAETIWEIIRAAGCFDIAKSLDDVRRQIYLAPKTVPDFDYFRTRFDIQNRLHSLWNDWSLALIARQVCSDLKAEQIEQSTLTVSLNKFAVAGDLPAAGEWVFGILNQAVKEAGLSVNYLLSVSYDWPRDLQIQTLKLLEPLGKYVAGIDFVGSEIVADWSLYPKLIEPWREQKKTVRAHVGERQGTSDNISIAIHKLRVSRIAHGIYATQEQQLEAIKAGIVFDMSIHSNICTGAIDPRAHPIGQMQKAGCAITIGTDDPVQFNCTLEDEYRLAEKMGADRKILLRVAEESRI